MHRERFRAFAKQEAVNLFWDVSGSIVYALGIYTFAAYAGFAPGGITGASMIINYLTGSPIGTMAVLLNIPIILVSLKYLGKGYLLRTLQTLVVNALFIDVVMPMLPHYTGSPLLAALFSGGLSGLGLSIIYNAGSCTGGSDLVIMSLRKLKPHLSIGEITMMIDGSLILVGAFVYKNIDAVLYGILFTLVSTYVIDHRMEGYASGKMSLIISDRHAEIAELIQQELRRGATLLKGEGTYTRREKNVLMCACQRHQLPKLRKMVQETDPDAMMIVMEYNEVRGRGFQPYE